MILLFQIIFRNSFQEVVISWVFGVFTKSIVVSILDFWHISPGRCLICWLVKKIITFESGRHIEKSFSLKEFVTWRVCEMLSDVLFLWTPCSDQFEIDSHGFRVKTHMLGRHVLNRLIVDKHGSGFLFSLMVLKRKAPIELGAMFCWFIIKDMDFIKTGRFFRKPTSWAPCSEMYGLRKE